MVSNYQDGYLIACDGSNLICDLQIDRYVYLDAANGPFTLFLLGELNRKTTKNSWYVSCSNQSCTAFKLSLVTRPQKNKGPRDKVTFG